MNENLKKAAKLAEKHTDANDFAKAGCEDGIFLSRAEGRRIWANKEWIIAKMKRSENDNQEG